MSSDDPDAAPTLRRGGTALPATERDTSTADRADAAPGEAAATWHERRAYQLGELIARGGMGEVVSATDVQIGREVAIKRLRGEAPSEHAIARFLREARIQARLDHPAIVPVHELGFDDAGRPYFTMKRLTGVTLQHQLAERAPVRALLRAFVDVCLAVQFAHARGIVHRDLKPANIMLGEYGEVYVLDWGIAHVLAEPGRAASNADLGPAVGATQVGELLGTPGYMAPEQARGEAVGRAADVYALGAILFEILAGEPLHPAGTAGIAAAIGAPQQSPAHRVPDRDLPPELDALCHDALADPPGARPTARALADGIQQYLDGDRDLERRKALARDMVGQARGALASSDPDGRAAAIHRAGRALALDPESTDAAQLAVSLILEPPRDLPPPLAAALEAEQRRVATERLRASIYALFVLAAMLLLLPLTHIKSWTTLAGCVGVLAASIAVLSLTYVRRRPIPVLATMVALALSYAFTRVLGPFVLSPVFVAGALLPVTAIPAFNVRPHWVLGWLAVAALGPLALEWAGVFASTWSMVDGGVRSTSAIFDGHRSRDAAVLVIANFALLGAAGMYALDINRRVRVANEKLFVQAWHLRQLLPGG